MPYFIAYPLGPNDKMTCMSVFMDGQPWLIIKVYETLSKKVHEDFQNILQKQPSLRPSLLCIKYTNDTILGDLASTSVSESASYVAYSYSGTASTANSCNDLTSLDVQSSPTQSQQNEPLENWWIMLYKTFEETNGSKKGLQMLIDNSNSYKKFDPNIESKCVDEWKRYSKMRLLLLAKNT